MQARLFLKVLNLMLCCAACKGRDFQCAGHLPQCQLGVSNCDPSTRCLTHDMVIDIVHLLGLLGRQVFIVRGLALLLLRR